MALKSLRDLTSEDFQLFIDSFDTVVTDCDCVLWLDDVSLSGSPEVINQLKKMGKNIFYMTNNSTKTRDQFVNKCNQLGFYADKDEIISTAYLAAVYLHQKDFKQRVYIVGPPSIAEELKQFSIEGFGSGPDIMPEADDRKFKNITKLEECVGAVIVGYDEHISYPKLRKAFAYLNNQQCLFIATNNDPTKKVKNPELKLPGAGCMVEAVRASSKRDPIYMGKPDVYMQQTILSNAKVNPHRTLMIGDKPSTDVLLGKRCGFKTLMVLSGSTTLEQVCLWKESQDPLLQELVPEYYISKLGDLLPQLEELHRK